MEMINKQILKRFSAGRGFVFEPLEEAFIPRQKNVHVVVSRPGAVRGNHYHQVGTETLVICGPAMVRIRRGDHLDDYSIPTDQIWRLVIPPGISHAIQNTGDADNLLIAFNTAAHDRSHPDTVADTLIPTP